MCEQQVEDHQYDSDERMCEDCLNAPVYCKLTCTEDLPDKMVKDFIQHRDTGDEHDFGETRNAQHFSEQDDRNMRLAKALKEPHPAHKHRIKTLQTFIKWIKEVTY